jgi:hypothetical protein
VVIDERALALDPALPPGAYVLWAGLVDPATGERLPAVGSADGRLRLGELRIEP